MVVMMFFSFIKNVMANKYTIETCKHVIILMEFMGFSFKIFKVIFPY
jgi:hypothetical protein